MSQKISSKTLRTTQPKKATAIPESERMAAGFRSRLPYTYGMSTTATVLSVVLGIVFVSAGLNKFSSSELAEVAPDHLGITRGTYRIVGVLELLGAVGLALGIFGVEFLGGLAAICLGLLMVGAVVLHIKAGDPFAIGKGFAQKSAESIKGWLPAGALAVLAFVTAVLILL